MKKIFIAISLLFSLTITSANAVEVTQEAKITGLYVAFFNRAADQAGLTYWTTTADNVAKQGGDVSSVFKTLSKGFATHPTFTSTYAHLNNEEFVTAIYKNALGRDGDAEGIAYWTDLLDRGMIRSDMVATFVELSMVTDLTPENYPSLSAEELATAQLRQDLISNKVKVAVAFTKQLEELSNVENSDAPESDPAYLASIMIISEVTETEVTVSNTLGFLEGIIGSDDPVGQINASDSLGGDSLGEGVLEENDSGSDSSGQQGSENSSTANSEGNTVDQGSADGSGGSDHQGVGDPLEESDSGDNSSGQQDSENSSTANSEGNTVDQGNETDNSTSNPAASNNETYVDNHGDIVPVLSEKPDVLDIDIGDGDRISVTIFRNINLNSGLAKSELSKYSAPIGTIERYYTNVAVDIDMRCEDYGFDQSDLGYSTTLQNGLKFKQYSKEVYINDIEYYYFSCDENDFFPAPSYSNLSGKYTIIHSHMHRKYKLPDL